MKNLLYLLGRIVLGVTILPFFSLNTYAELVPWRGNQAYYVEATEAEITAPFEFVEDTDALSGAYIVYPDPTNDDNENSLPAPADGHAVFTLRNIDPGSYYLHGRILGHDFDSDSFWVLVNDDDLDNAVAWNTASHQSEWGWWHYPHHGEPPATIELDHGENTITIIRRKSNTRLDALVLTRDEDFSPADEQLLPEYSEPDWWSWDGPDGGPVKTEDSPDDLALAVAGQLKHTATMARKKMDENFPGGAGEDIDNVATWDPEAADDHVVINLGQLKAVALPFYNRLQTVVADGEHFYPWPGESPDEDNYAAATLGQLKHVFSFEIPEAPSEWEWPPEREDPWSEQPPSSWLTEHDVTANERHNALMAYQHWQIDTDPKMEGPIEFERFDGPGQTQSFRAIYTWTAAMEYVLWMQRWVEQADGGMEKELDDNDEVPNYLKYALYWHPEREWPVSAGEPFPEIETSGSEHSITFIRRTNQFLSTLENEARRIGWWVEEDTTGNGDWEWIEHQEGPPDTAGLEEGLERVHWTVSFDDSDPNNPQPRTLRVVMRVEPKPLLFAHYMPTLYPAFNPGGYPWAPYNAYNNLMSNWYRHEKLLDENGDPILDDNGHPLMQGVVYKRSGGYRDYSLVPHDFYYEDLEDSMKLEIRRAQRMGIDGFALDLWAGNRGPGLDHQGEAAIRAMFAAAEAIYNDDLADPSVDAPRPFLITVVPDAASLPGQAYADSEELPDSVANEITFWLDEFYDDADYSQHVPQRGGKPLVLGYASNHYLHNWIARHQHLMPSRFSYSDGGTNPPLFEWKQGGLLDTEGNPVEAGRLWRDAFDDLQARIDGKRGEGSEVEILWQLDIGGVFAPDHGSSTVEDYEKAAGDIARYFAAANAFLRTRLGVDTPGEEIFTPRMRRAVLRGGAEWGEPINLQWSHNAYPDPVDVLLEGWSAAMAEDPRDPQRSLSPEERSTLIQMTTWNDYNEESNFSPGQDIRYVPMLLTEYLGSLWKTGEPPSHWDFSRDTVMLLHRRHASFASDGTPMTFFPFEGDQPAFHRTPNSPNDDLGKGYIAAIVIPKRINDEPVGGELRLVTDEVVVIDSFSNGFWVLAQHEGDS